MLRENSMKCLLKYNFVEIFYLNKVSKEFSSKIKFPQTFYYNKISTRYIKGYIKGSLFTLKLSIENILNDF